jgi:hypothetical protein
MQLKNKVQYQYVIDIMEMPQQGQRINVKFFWQTDDGLEEFSFDFFSVEKRG